MKRNEQFHKEHHIDFIPTIENKKCYNYGIFIPSNTQIENLSFCATVNKFLEEYVAKFCTFNTVRSYKSLFKMNIIPYFKDKK